MTPSRSGWLSLLSALLLAALVHAPSGSAVAADTLLVINQVSLDQFPEVAIYFTAADSTGLPIADISRDRLQVLHNGRSVPDLALDLAETEQDGLAVVVAIDTSGSMQGQPLDYARGAVRLLLERMGPRDRGALVSFGQTVQVVQDLTGDQEALSRALDSLVAQGDTALYDGTFQAITLAAQHSLGRRAVVVITDGEDTHSSLTLDDVIGKARETNTAVSVIGFGEVLLEPVQRLALVTGGSLSVAPDGDQLSERAAQMSDRLRKQYVVRYRAPDSRPPENEVELVLNQDGQQVRASQRFPAPPIPPLTVGLEGLAPGATVRGLVDLRPMIPNEPRVDQVEYVLDGAPLHTATDAPYTFTWDTSTVPPGEHLLTVKARLGEHEAEQNLPLTIAPAILLSITLPGGPDVFGRVTLLAEVDAAAPVGSVEWAVDGQPIGTSPQPPFNLEWDTTGLPPGEHVVTAQAQDERGNVGRASQTVRIVPVGPAASPGPAVAAPGASPQAVLTTPLPGGTATPAATRAATSTPAGSSRSGVLGRVSPPVWIGIGTVIVVAVGIMYASSRRRASGVIDASAVRAAPDRPGPPTSRLGLPGGNGPSTAGPEHADPATDALRSADTAGVTLLPPGPSAPSRGPGHASLTVVIAGTPPRTWPLGIDQIIGRAPGPGVIVVADPQVSRRHARISWEGGHFVYRDLGPMNPTRRAGRTLPNPYILRDGDQLQVGRAALTFRA